MGLKGVLDADIEVAGLRDMMHEKDLESQCIKKDAGVTITALDGPRDRPVLGRRKTTGSLNGVSGVAAETLAAEGEEDALTKIGNFLWKIHTASVITRYALYILPVAALLAIPLVLTATVYDSVRIDGIRICALFIWIEVIWLALWVCKLVARAFPIVFQAACGLISTGIRKYSLVLKALEIPLSLFLWTIVSYATSSSTLCVFDKGEKGCGRWNKEHTEQGVDWIKLVGQVFKAGIVVTAIFLVEKTIMQLISINYHRKQFDHKIRESKKLIRLLDLMYDASRKLFPEFCSDFEDDDADIQSSTLTAMRTKLHNAGMGTRVFADMHRVRDKVTAAFGAMASDVTGQQLFSTTNAHSIVLKALETECSSRALARRLWLSFAASGQDSLYKNDLTEVLGPDRTDLAEEIFHMLDRDSNGDVSLEEMTQLIVNAGTERKDRASSMHDISQAIAVLDRLLSFVVLLAIAFIYATFFSKAFANKTAQLWTSFTGLAFAIGGTVTEFLACCIFLFIKHPYDVGDRVTIDKQELVVKHISLMYSVFLRVDSDGIVQIPHNVANNLWIENVTRSRQMKERLNINVAATTSTEDILALRGELHKFVTADENRRDFQPDFDIELISIGDMKSLELRVEIRHKSNFANEHVRNSRRNKFMCELLASMRRVPIDPPGGSAAPLGDPANPAYSVSVSDNEAVQARAHKAAKVEADRLYPVGMSLSELAPEATSAGFLTPAMAMFPGLKSRSRGAQLHESQGRRSSEFQRPF